MPYNFQRIIHTGCRSKPGAICLPAHGHTEYILSDEQWYFYHALISLELFKQMSSEAFTILTLMGFAHLAKLLIVLQLVSSAKISQFTITVGFCDAYFVRPVGQDMLTLLPGPLFQWSILVTVTVYFAFYAQWSRIIETGHSLPLTFYIV